MDAEEVAELIHWPLDEWPGFCYGIAECLLDAGIVEGHLRYGHWLGPVAHGSMFWGRPLIRHGWVEKPDGTIVDPTRWVFEDAEPYIYEGRNDFYDAGGNVFLRLNMTAPPARTWADDEKVWEVEFPEAVEELLPDYAVEKSFEQLMWIAHLPLDLLGAQAAETFTALILSGHSALIPIDNRQLALGEHWRSGLPGGNDAESIQS